LTLIARDRGWSRYSRMRWLVVEAFSTSGTRRSHIRWTFV
jgi:hypothetical protein